MPSSIQMTEDNDLKTTTSSMSTDDDSKPLCFSPLLVIKHVTLAIGIVLLTATLVMIPCHRRLRKPHHIFPYNLVLSDFSGAVGLAILEGTTEFPLQLERLIIIISTTSFVVSLLSIVLVTGYQFITIRVDPFGVHNIITTPRLIGTSVLTWGISCSITSFIVVTSEDYQLYIFLLLISLAMTVISGLCYLFIYRSVAMVPCDGIITRQRKEENRRVLRTFGLVFGTTVLCWICPMVNWTLMSLGFEDECLYNAGDIMMCVNWIANSIIYWWRLKEFRSMFKFCKRYRATVSVQISLVTDEMQNRVLPESPIPPFPRISQ